MSGAKRDINVTLIDANRNLPLRGRFGLVVAMPLLWMQDCPSHSANQGVWETSPVLPPLGLQY